MGHGLTHPADLVAWRRWQESRHPLRRAARSARVRMRPPAEGPLDLLVAEPGSDVLVAVEATHASVDRAVVAPLKHLDPERTAVVAPVGWEPPAAYADHERRTLSVSDLTLPGVRAVLAAGHYTAIGAAAFALAEAVHAAFFVVQHGALTPYAPPLPPGAHLLAWSDADADFWRSGRTDVDHEVVGSQLLWGAGLVTGAGAPSSTSGAAGAPSSTNGGADTRLTYLGQMHAAELSRARLVHAAASACRSQGAVYRPHPSEHDLLSRLTHDAFRRAGITVDGTTPLAELTGPVVSVFSTGVLEAAAQGRDAWVDFPRPPAWLGEFWERYGMHRSGSTPTPPPVRPAVEPARRVAELLAEAAS